MKMWGAALLLWATTAIAATPTPTAAPVREGNTARVCFGPLTTEDGISPAQLEALTWWIDDASTGVRLQPETTVAIPPTPTGSPAVGTPTPVATYCDRIPAEANVVVDDEETVEPHVLSYIWKWATGQGLAHIPLTVTRERFGPFPTRTLTPTMGPSPTATQTPA